jgi:hypothetical protein
MTDAQAILANIRAVSARFAQERGKRQRRRTLVQADFGQLSAAGFLLAVVPLVQGGIWERVARSTRPICEMLRTLAYGDPSAALVTPGVGPRHNSRGFELLVMRPLPRHG